MYGLDYEVKVNRDGSGEIVFTYGFTEEFLEQMGTTAAEYTMDIRENAEGVGFTVEEHSFTDRIAIEEYPYYEEREIAGIRARKYVHDVTQAIDLEAIFGEDRVITSGNIEMETGMFTINVSKDGIVDLSQLEDLSNYGVHFKYSISLPVNVVEHNADYVSSDGRTLTWELAQGEENSIQFEARGLAVATYVVIIGAITLVVIVAIVVILVKKKM